LQRSSADSQWGPDRILVEVGAQLGLNHSQKQPAEQEEPQESQSRNQIWLGKEEKG